MSRPETAAVRLLAGIREPVRLVALANIDIETGGLVACDGVTPVAGDRILLSAQTDKTEIGIYTATAIGWERASDARSSRAIARGVQVHVQEGSTKALSTWEFQTTDPNPGDDDILVVEIARGIAISMFGEVGNDSNDNTPGLNLAIAAANGLPIYLGEGTYRFTVADIDDLSIKVYGPGSYRLIDGTAGDSFIWPANDTPQFLYAIADSSGFRRLSLIYGNAGAAHDPETMKDSWYSGNMAGNAHNDGDENLFQGPEVFRFGTYAQDAVIIGQAGARNSNKLNRATGVGTNVFRQAFIFQVDANFNHDWYTVADRIARDFESRFPLVSAFLNDPLTPTVYTGGTPLATKITNAGLPNSALFATTLDGISYNSAFSRDVLIHLMDGEDNTGLGAKAGAGLVGGNRNTLVGAISAYDLLKAHDVNILGAYGATNSISAADSIIGGTYVFANAISFETTVAWGQEFGRYINVTAASLSPSAWVTATGYVIGNVVTQAGDKYVCLVNHTSGTFATDLTAGKWRLGLAYLQTLSDIDDTDIMVAASVGSGYQGCYNVATLLGSVVHGALTFRDAPEHRVEYDTISGSRAMTNAQDPVGWPSNRHGHRIVSGRYAWQYGMPGDGFWIGDGEVGTNSTSSRGQRPLMSGDVRTLHLVFGQHPNLSLTSTSLDLAALHLYQFFDPANDNRVLVVDPTLFAFPTAMHQKWSSTADAHGTADTGILRSAAGILKITDGAAAYGTLDALAYRVNGTKVVGARDTGFAVMTGTSNEAATYDTATVTLPQLAGRVMALQAALTTHGLIGT